MAITVDIDNRQDALTITETSVKLIRQAIVFCYQMEKYPDHYQVSLSFVDNEEIHDLNRKYRGKDEPTDVLSFPVDSESPEVDEKLLGDIVISTEKIIEQAEEYGHSVNREMIYLLVHSIFHLMGYDHMDENNKRIMRRKEEQVMEAMNLAE